jgi:hypothetical protein
MKNIISAVLGSNAKDSNPSVDCPHSGYYGGLLNQGAYGK